MKELVLRLKVFKDMATGHIWINGGEADIVRIKPHEFSSESSYLIADKTIIVEVPEYDQFPSPH